MSVLSTPQELQDQGCPSPLLIFPGHRDSAISAPEHHAQGHQERGQPQLWLSLRYMTLLGNNLQTLKYFLIKQSRLFIQ